VSLAIWDHTMLLATRHKRTLPALTPAGEGWCSIYPGLECRGGGGLNPQFMSTDAHFWVKIRFKFQSLGKISNILAADPPVLLGQFQHWIYLPLSWHSMVPGLFGSDSAGIMIGVADWSQFDGWKGHILDADWPQSMTDSRKKQPLLTRIFS